MHECLWTKSWSWISSICSKFWISFCFQNFPASRRGKFVQILQLSIVEARYPKKVVKTHSNKTRDWDFSWPNKHEIETLFWPIRGMYQTHKHRENEKNIIWIQQLCEYLKPRANLCFVQPQCQCKVAVNRQTSWHENSHPSHNNVLCARFSLIRNRLCPFCPLTFVKSSSKDGKSWRIEIDFKIEAQGLSYSYESHDVCFVSHMCTVSPCPETWSKFVWAEPVWFTSSPQWTVWRGTAAACIFSLSHQMLWSGTLLLRPQKSSAAATRFSRVRFSLMRFVQLSQPYQPRAMLQIRGLSFNFPCFCDGDVVDRHGNEEHFGTASEISIFGNANMLNSPTKGFHA